MTLKRIITQGLIDGYLGSVFAGLEQVVNDQPPYPDLADRSKGMQSAIPEYSNSKPGIKVPELPGLKADPIDISLSGTHIKRPEDFIQIINQVYKKRKPLCQFTKSVGIPDFLEFSFLSKGIHYGKAVCRILRTIEDPEDALQLSQLVEKAILGRRNAVGEFPFSRDEMAKLISLNKQQKKKLFDGFNDDNFYLAFRNLSKIKQLLPELPVGTGFLIAKNYLLTSNHVIEGIDPSKLILEFNYELEFNPETGNQGNSEDTRRFHIDRIVVANNTDLDYALLKLKASADEPNAYLQISEDENMIAPPLSFDSESKLLKLSESNSQLKFVPEVVERLKKARLLSQYRQGVGGLDGEPVTIIQHPRGDYKKIVVSSNRVINMSDDFVYYEADAEQGSSGSPVFNQEWKLIGLHRAYIAENNTVIGYEGVRTCKIAQDLRHNKLKGNSELIEILFPKKPRERNNLQPESI